MAGAPETKTVLGTGGRKEVVDLLVDVLSASQILGTTDLSLNQVITVDGGRSGDSGKTGAHELEDGHLGGGILASNAVGAELEVRGTSLDLLSVGVVQVRVKDLLGVCQGAVEAGTNNVEVLAHLPAGRHVHQNSALQSHVSHNE